MKINTISTYILVCLLARGQWNLILPVKAGGEGSTGTTVVKLFKADADGNQVEMTETTDFTKKDVVGNDKYEFVSGVKCVKVMIEDKELWKSGDHSVQEPKYVTYNSTTHTVVVRGSKSLTYKKDSNTGKWEFVDPTAKQTGSGTGQKESTPGSASSGSSPSVTAPAESASSHVAKGTAGGPAARAGRAASVANSSAPPASSASTTPNSQATPVNEAAPANEGAQATPSDLKLFKDDGSGNGVAMAENTDYEKKTDNDVVTYKFNKGVKCTLVKVDDKDVWKKGDNGVNEPELVTFNDTTKRVVLLDNAKSVTYKKGADGNWKHLMTINRPKRANSAKTGDSSQAAPPPGSDSSSVATPVPDSSSSVASPEAKVETDSTSTASPEPVSSE